jgi:chaperonin GroEL
MAKKVTFKHDAQQKILSGARIVADAVGSTLGPKANNVAIARPFGSPSVIHDGVSVAKEIELEDPEENIGAQLIIEAASKTNDKAGDGTTTATILTVKIAEEAIKNITAGANAMQLRKGMLLAKTNIVNQLREMAKPIDSDEDLRRVATISAQDEQIGTLIFSAYKKLGRSCIIAVEESRGTDMDIEYKQGMQFDKGWKSNYFVTNGDTQESVIEDPYILVTDARITNVNQIVEWANNLELTYGASQNVERKMISKLVVIAAEVNGGALITFIQNKMQGALEVNVIEAPQHGQAQKDILTDIATVTGGKFVSLEAGDKLETMALSDYGHAKRVVSTKDSTIIIGGAASKTAVNDRVKALTATLNKATGEFDQEKLKERIAKLTSGIAVINAGGASEMEMREKKERVIDAIEATKAALEEGIVPGGQVAYLSCVSHCEEIGDVKTGYDIVMSAIQKPFETLMINSGYEPGAMKERLTRRPKGTGIDVSDGDPKDVIKAGIIDPVKVSRVALENAVSTAGAMMTTNTIITEIPKKEQDGTGNSA